MGFEFSGQHIKDYHALGYAIFRDIIPAPLLTALREEADRGRPIARRLHGGNAQRLQPIAEHPEIDMGPFDELDGLPVLNRALDEIFGQVEGMTADLSQAREYLGILYEPGDSPYCMGWHRDYRDLWPGINLDKWQELLHDMRMFNQTNVALYDDGCLWAVPGSHLRRDTPEEIRRFPDRPIAYPDVSRMTPEVAEYTCRRYVRSMPGAVQIHLNAGDFMIYRNTLWHIGNYIPYIKRATIHGALLTPEYKDFFTHEFLPVFQNASAPRKWQNLNADTAAYRDVWLEMMATRYWNKLRAAPRRYGPKVLRRLGLALEKRPK